MAGAPTLNMLTVLCVWSGGFSAEYVTRLQASVRARLRTPHRFVCLTNESVPGVECMKPAHDWTGWWGKVEIFNPSLPFSRVLYIDLSVVITGDITEMAAQEGVVITKDFYHGTPSQSVLLYSVGDFAATYADFMSDPELWMQRGDRREAPDFGDQILMNRTPTPHMRYWQDVLPGQLVSYKVDCQSGIPPNARIVKFHGKPKPHDVGWLEPQYIESINTSTDVVLAQMRENARREVPRLRPHVPRTTPIAIVGGGPSLEETWQKIPDGAHVMALNGTHDWLIHRGVRPKYYVLLDAREHNVRFVANPCKTTEYLISAQCHPSVFDALEGRRVTLWWNLFDGMEDIPGPDELLIGGGATVGLRAMFIAYTLGYRDIHLFGFDSCYRDDAHHAYKQVSNDGESRYVITAAGRQFFCAPWMTKQAQQWMEHASTLIANGCGITTYGDGLIQHIAKHMRAA